jgi:putative oxidoreductase
MENILEQLSGLGWYALVWVLGVIFIVHGISKVKDPSMMAGFWWGSKTLAFIHGVGEILAGIAVALNIGQIYGALFMVVIMLGALFEKIFKWKVPFSSKTGTGWEFDLLLLAAALMVLIG